MFMAPCTEMRKIVGHRFRDLAPWGLREPGDMIHATYGQFLCASLNAAVGERRRVEGQDVIPRVVGGPARHVLDVFSVARGDVAEAGHDDDDEAGDFAKGEKVGHVDAGDRLEAVDGREGEQGQGCQEADERRWRWTSSEDHLG